MMTSPTSRAIATPMIQGWTSTAVVIASEMELACTMDPMKPVAMIMAME